MICPRLNNPKCDDFENCECGFSKKDENGNWYCEYEQIHGFFTENEKDW